jgi:hypothetical protein
VGGGGSGTEARRGAGAAGRPAEAKSGHCLTPTGDGIEMRVHVCAASSDRPCRFGAPASSSREGPGGVRAAAPQAVAVAVSSPLVSSAAPMPRVVSPSPASHQRAPTAIHPSIRVAVPVAVAGGVHEQSHRRGGINAG